MVKKEKLVVTRLLEPSDKNNMAGISEESEHSSSVSEFVSSLRLEDSVKSRRTKRKRKRSAGKRNAELGDKRLKEQSSLESAMETDNAVLNNTKPQQCDQRQEEVNDLYIVAESPPTPAAEEPVKSETEPLTITAELNLQHDVSCAFSVGDETEKFLLGICPEDIYGLSASRVEEGSQSSSRSTFASAESPPASVPRDLVTSTPVVNTKCNYTVTTGPIGRGDSFVPEILKASDIYATFTEDGDSCHSHEELKTDCQFYPKGTFYGLPMEVQKLFAELRGIHSLYEWQDCCLRLPGIAEGQNLIYSLPTSGGKTLVAEIIILQQILLKKKDVVFILPFVSLVLEKVNQIREFGESLGFAVEEYAASQGRFPPRKRRKKNSLYIATIEKGNGLVNSLIELGHVTSLGLVVVDELHMLGVEGRGAVLESCLAKIRFAAPNTQIIGMSATLSNITELAVFLGAKVFSDDFRPVELSEHIKIGHSIYNIEFHNGRATLGSSRVITSVELKKYPKEEVDKDHLILLVLEVLPKDGCLVFCPTKKNCQNVALLLTQHFPEYLQAHKKKEKIQLIETLKVEASGICPVLYQTIPYGVAYHHSGLSSEERKLIEESYLSGVTSVLVCTSTLAAGVNLPAKRVILRSPYVGAQFLTKSQYKQMTGRAGRAGFGVTGESIAITSEQDRQKVLDMLSSPMDSCQSSLLCDNGAFLASLILSLISLKLVVGPKCLMGFIRNTLLYVQLPEEDIQRKVQDGLHLLLSKEYIKIGSKTEPDSISYEATSLGVATFKGMLDVSIGHKVFSDLKMCQRCLVLSNDLHLLYLATPPDLVHSLTPQWMIYLQIFAKLSEDECKVAELIGVSEGIISRKATGFGRKLTDEMMSVYCRFFLSLMLRAMLKMEGSQSIWIVANQFQCSRGFLQSLLQSASSFAFSLVQFTENLPELWAINVLLPSLVKKLTYACSIEIVPLLEIKGLKQGRARQLYNAGYRTPQQLAQARPEDLCGKVEHLFPNTAKRLIKCAKNLLSEKLDELQDEIAEVKLFLPHDS